MRVLARAEIMSGYVRRGEYLEVVRELEELKQEVRQPTAHIICTTFAIVRSMLLSRL